MGRGSTIIEDTLAGRKKAAEFHSAIYPAASEDMAKAIQHAYECGWVARHGYELRRNNLKRKR